MKRLEAIFMIAVFIAVLVGGYYAITQAIGINRVYGPEYVEATGNGAETLFVDIYCDSLVTMRNGLTVSGGTVALPANEIGNAEVAAIDSTWLTANSLGWGVFTAVVQESIRTSRFKWKKAGDANYKYAVPLRFQGGTDITITVTDHSTDSATVSIAYSGAGGGAWFGQHVNGSAISTDTMVYLAENGILLREVVGSGVQDTIGIKIDTTTLKTQLKVSTDLWYINDNASTVKDTNIASDAVTEAKLKCVNSATDEYALTYEATTGDFEWQLLNLNTINWTSQPFELMNFSLREGNAGNVSIYYPLAVDSVDWCVKHTNTTGATDDIADTVVFTAMIPYVSDTAVTVDSLTFNFRASSATVNVVSIKPILYRYRGDLKTKIANYTGSATAGGGVNLWTHRAITASLGNVAGGDRLSIWFVVLTDHGHNLYHDMPIVWAKGHK